MTAHRNIIPFQALIAYANHLNMSDFERDILIRVVRSVDLCETNAFNKNVKTK